MASPRLTAEAAAARQQKALQNGLRLRLQIIQTQLTNVTSQLRTYGFQVEETGRLLRDLASDLNIAIDHTVRLDAIFDEANGDFEDEDGAEEVATE